MLDSHFMDSSQGRIPEFSKKGAHQYSNDSTVSEVQSTSFLGVSPPSFLEKCTLRLNLVGIFNDICKFLILLIAK